MTFLFCPLLPRAAMTLVIRHALPADVTELAGADAWIAALASYANGLPATGLAFAASGLSYWRQHGVLATVEWTIVDAQNRSTQVVLTSFKTGANPPDLFVFNKPQTKK